MFGGTLAALLMGIGAGKPWLGLRGTGTTREVFSDSRQAAKGTVAVIADLAEQGT